MTATCPLCYALWQPGDDVIVPPPGSCGVAKERMEKPAAEVRCLDWLMCLKKCPK
jgi:peroxiredoxin (alkyl hydroperoxide reductase subunit C)